MEYEWCTESGEAQQNGSRHAALRQSGRNPQKRRKRTEDHHGMPRRLGPPKGQCSAQFFFVGRKKIFSFFRLPVRRRRRSNFRSSAARDPATNRAAPTPRRTVAPGFSLGSLWRRLAIRKFPSCLSQFRSLLAEVNSVHWSIDMPHGTYGREWYSTLAK